MKVKVKLRSSDLVFTPESLTIVEEGAVKARVEMLSDKGEEVLVKLETVRVVLSYLPNTVQELHEDGRVVR